VAREPESATEYELTNADWGMIHKLAWLNNLEDNLTIKEGSRPISFSEALEIDPTAAIKHYAERHLRLNLNRTKLKIVKLRPRPECVPDDFLEDVNPFPPSCC
jgi:hypothetical protein